MKRFFSLALILALLGTTSLNALAEAPEADISEAVEAEAEAVVIAEDTGLTLEGYEEAPAIMEAPAVEEAPAAEEPAVVDADGTVEAEQAVEAATGPATGIALSAQAITIGVKEKYTLAAIAQPDGSILPAVSWRSENPKYAKVDANGVVTGVKKGTTTVYAQMEGGAEAACQVTIMKAPGKLNISSKKLTLGADGMSAQLSYTVPKGCTSNTFTWSSSNTKVAVVDANGVVTTVGPGKASIKVKAYNGKGGTCKVTVLGAPTAIAFPTPSLSIAVDQHLKLEPGVTFSSKKAAAAGIVYAIDGSSADPGCVSLNPSTGELTGLRKGSAVITATTYNGKTAVLPVTVAAAPAGISLSENAVVIGVKDVYSGLLANLTLPAGETECASTLTWTTSNKKVAKVDANGVITGVKKGSCTITATTVNGLKDSCKVTVWKAPKKISLSPSNGTLQTGEVNQYKVVFPKGTGGTVRFVSSDAGIATVDDDGVITAVSPGEVTITAVSFNGKKATGKLTVTSSTVDLPTNEYSSIDSQTSQYSDDMTNAQKLEYVIYMAQSQLNKPYIYGSGYTKDANPSGFDCSGLVYWSFLNAGIRLQATAHRQGYDDSQAKIASMGSLKRGDIVCFNTVDDGADDLCDHTGIYLGNGKFIHASSSAKKVIVSTLASGYYSRVFQWGRRVLP